MSDAVDRGFTVTEMAPMEQAIDVSRETAAAFIGRALRGPLNEPVLVRNFGEFRRRFGDSWSRSSLGPAVRQFFDHGGLRLYVVRVANNARGALLCLPASGSALVMRAVEPGSSEQVRAAVDLDGIDSDNEELFNLTLQRIDAVTGHVIDQEFYRRISYRQGADNFVGDSLLASSLVRVEPPYPTHRPEATQGPGARLRDTYVDHVQAGADGQELSDYDLIGSRARGTGLFALSDLDDIDLLYLPPPGKGCNLGPASLLAAEMFCRQRGAMLITDPGSGWEEPGQAIAGIRAAGLASPNMIGYFPRMRLRHDGSAPARAVGGALAGLLCRLDRCHGPWSPLDSHDSGFSRALVPAVAVDDAGLRALTREGLNVIVPGPAGRARLRGSVTLGRGVETSSLFASLPVRRLCLRVLSSIERATRWAVFVAPHRSVAGQVRAQITAYLAALSAMGAFASSGFHVECTAAASRGVTILVTFRPHSCSVPLSFTLHQAVAGCRITPTAFAPVMDLRPTRRSTVHP